MSTQVYDQKKGKRKNPKGILSPKALTEQLLELQHLGFVEQNIDTKKYKANIPITTRLLFFNDVLEFVRAKFRESTKTNDEETVISGPLGWIAMVGEPEIGGRLSEKRLLEQLIEKRLKSLKNLNALSTVSRIIEDSWKEYCFLTTEKSTKLDMKRLNIIEIYKKFLREVAEQLYPLKLPEQDMELYAELFAETKKKMLEDYAGVNVPKEMIKIATERRMRKIAAEHRASITMRPSNLKELGKTLEVFDWLKKHCSDQAKDNELKEEAFQEIEKKLLILKTQGTKKFMKNI